MTLTASRTLLLIRHSAVIQDKDGPASQWALSPKGCVRSQQFASQIAPFQPAWIFTSHELKAIETGKILALALNLPVESVDNLHEHDRRGVPFLASEKNFRDAVGRFFANPDELVFGLETAAAASQRIDSAVARLLNQRQPRNLAVVTHGTVMTLYICRYNPTIDPMTFWDSLQMPCAAVLQVPGMNLVELILPA